MVTSSQLKRCKTTDAMSSLRAAITTLPRRSYHYYQGFQGRTGTVQRQSNFEGVFNPYLWDSQCGFGFNSHEELVLVDQEADSIRSSDHNKVWFEILNPSMDINHMALQHELQRNVLTYDIDAIKPEILRDDPWEDSIPIFKANVKCMLKSSTEMKRHGKEE